ncbi:MAG: hypothetical protein ACOC3V_00355, partial [bacterium]
GKAKKFLFDYNACEALNITDKTKVSFIVSSKYLFLADVSHLDLEKWGIHEEEVNIFNKKVSYYTIGDVGYRFKSFNNSNLYRVIEEEHEINTEVCNIFSLNFLTGEALSDYIDKETYNLLERMDINSLYLLDLRDTVDEIENIGNYKNMPYSGLHDYLKQRRKPKFKKPEVKASYSLLDYMVTTGYTSTGEKLNYGDYLDYDDPNKEEKENL